VSQIKSKPNRSIAPAIVIQPTNWGAIFAGFKAKGIPEAEIKPRENVFTFNAWRALGRTVRRGEHGVKVETWIEREAVDPDDPQKHYQTRHHRYTTVFHITQTELIETRKSK
jgi:hypothetical protein